MMTAWVGITGGIGSGKTQVAAYFSKLGVPILDADAINREIINNPQHIALQQIAQQFGVQAINISGCLNRDYMRELIFRQPEKKMQLEKILHPHIMHAIQAKQQEYADEIYGIIELPTLKPHSPFLALIQRVLVVESEKQKRIERIKRRNGFDEQTIHSIINNQISDEERLTIADDVLHNNADLAQLEQQVQQQHCIYLQQFT